MHSLSIVFDAIARALAVGIEHWYAFLLAYLIVRRYLPERYSRAVDSAIRVVDSAVLARQSIVRDLKNPAKDGTWDEKAARAMRDAAVREAELMLGPQGDVLRSALAEKGGAEVDLHAFLGSLVEARVESQRQRTVPQTIAPATATAQVTTPASADAPSVASVQVTVGGAAVAATDASVAVPAADAKPVTDEAPAQ